jgi:hypothetical protein
MEDLRYPIGPYQKPFPITAGQLEEWIRTIADFPARIRSAVSGLSDQQLDTPYRPDGWTIRQVVNHCADSHMNAIIRLKLALTEENPTILPYFEALWAELPDTKELDPAHSLLLLEGLHARWVVVLRSLRPDQLKRTYVHPEYGKTFFLEEVIAQYAWHCNHHLAHITTLKERMEWD